MACRRAGFLCPACWSERRAIAFCGVRDLTIVFSEGDDENRNGCNSGFCDGDDCSGQRCAGLRKRRAGANGVFVLRLREKRWQDCRWPNLWNGRAAQEHQGSIVPGIRVANGASHLSDQAERRQASSAFAGGRNGSIPDSKGQVAASSSRSRRQGARILCSFDDSSLGCHGREQAGGAGGNSLAAEGQARVNQIYLSPLYQQCSSQVRDGENFPFLDSASPALGFGCDIQVLSSSPTPRESSHATFPEI